MDSNGDGIGDLQGVRSRLDYLQSLGIDAVWLSPINKSPNADMGYDIADYRAIMTEFGTMADFDALLADMHARGMRLIMDLVVAYTSDEHAWFQESRSSRESAKRDWYFWRPAKPDGSPPNNWRSEFGGSAWEWDAKTGEYYLHTFSKKQPDLNWTSPSLRAAIHDMVRWWLDKGVDGFRMDVIGFISKAPGLPDAPLPAGAKVTAGGSAASLAGATTLPGDSAASILVQPGNLANNRPEVHDYLRELNENVLSHYDIMTVGECHGMNQDGGLLYMDRSRRELNLIFQFDHKWHFNRREWKHAFSTVRAWFDACRGHSWNTAVLGNHDGGRIVSNGGDAKNFRAASAKMFNTLLLTLPGTPFVYQGEELGMADAVFDNISDYQDVLTLNQYQELVAQGRSPADALRELQALSRDRSRAPMQWSTAPQAGFTTPSAKPWLPINADYSQWNAAVEDADPQSVLNAFRRLAKWRRATPAFIHADFRLLDTGREDLQAYTRTAADGDEYLVALNFSGAQQTLALDDAKGRPWQVTYTTSAGDKASASPGESLQLAPWQGTILHRGK